MITFENVSKTFESEDENVEALKDINFSIEKNEKFGIIGESGAGKSTLLRLINALETPTKGKVMVNGQSVHDLAKDDLRLHKKKIGMIFQQFNLLYNKTVEENVALPLTLHDYEDALDVDEVLEFVGLSDKKDQYPSQLSGGQKQRVGIARALVFRPDILLCDEPTSALDEKTTEEIVRVIDNAHKKYNMTVVLVTHELNVVKLLCDRAAIVEQGELTDLISVDNSDTLGETVSYYDRVVEVLKDGDISTTTR